MTQSCRVRSCALLTGSARASAVYARWTIVILHDTRAVPPSPAAGPHRNAHKTRRNQFESIACSLLEASMAVR